MCFVVMDGILLMIVEDNNLESAGVYSSFVRAVKPGERHNEPGFKPT